MPLRVDYRHCWVTESKLSCFLGLTLNDANVAAALLAVSSDVLWGMCVCSALSQVEANANALYRLVRDRALVGDFFSDATVDEGDEPIGSNWMSLLECAVRAGDISATEAWKQRIPSFKTEHVLWTIIQLAAEYQHPHILERSLVGHRNCDFMHGVAGAAESGSRRWFDTIVSLAARQGVTIDWGSTIAYAVPRFETSVTTSIVRRIYELHPTLDPLNDDLGCSLLEKVCRHSNLSEGARIARFLASIPRGAERSPRRDRVVVECFRIAVGLSYLAGELNPGLVQVLLDMLDQIDASSPSREHLDIADVLGVICRKVRIDEAKDIQAVARIVAARLPLQHSVDVFFTHIMEYHPDLWHKYEYKPTLSPHFVSFCLDELRVDVNARNFRGQTALQYVFSRGDELERYWKIVERLLEEPTADLSRPGSFLRIALVNDCKKVVDVLLRCPRVDINARNAEGQTALYQFFKSERALSWNGAAVTRLLEDPRLDLSVPTADGSLLHIAASRGSARLVSLLLRHPGADVNATNAEGHTAIRHLFCQPWEPSTDVVRQLLEAPRLDLSVPPNDRGNLLEIARAKGWQSVTQLLDCRRDSLTIETDQLLDSLDSRILVYERLLRELNVRISR